MIKVKENLSLILIVGLGNPGEDYYLTRHSLGFQAVDAFAIKHNFPKFKKTINNALISEGRFADKKIILVKPQTFMNKSGEAVKQLVQNYILFQNKSYANLMGY